MIKEKLDFLKLSILIIEYLLLNFIYNNKQKLLLISILN